MEMWLLFLGLAVTAAAAGTGSCVGRCGEVFTRGQQCTCDFSCLLHNECCQDFESTCTTARSCQGRCGEPFRRGQLCECDPQCVLYNTCCTDFQLHCDASASASNPRTLQPMRAAASGGRKSERSRKRSNSDSEEWSTAVGPCLQYPGSRCPNALSGLGHPVVSTSLLQQGVSNIPVSLLPMSSHSRAPYSPAPGSSLPSDGALSLGSSVPVSPSGPGGVADQVNAHLMLSPGSSQGGIDQTGPRPRPRPSTLQDVAQVLGLSMVEGGSRGLGTGLFAAMDICGDSPMNGLTALSNGTILIFKGELFWSVDPVSRSVGHPQSITDTLGVSSPIDTVFTRYNCHRNTYIVKGDQYWRLDETMVVEPGFPKPLASEFPGLTGSISAALAVPATGSTPETVYFFKKGDIIQRYIFPPSSTPCSMKPRSSLKRHLTRQAEVLQSEEINVKVSLKGFPTPVTSALSMPSLQRADIYHHYVFSGSLFFNVQILGKWPALAKPDPSAALAPLPILSPVAIAANMVAQNGNRPPPANSIRVWLRCP